MQSIIVGKAWCQACEAADHMTSTVGEQRTMNVGAQLIFSLMFSSLETQDVATYI